MLAFHQTGNNTWWQAVYLFKDQQAVCKSPVSCAINAACETCWRFWTKRFCSHFLTKHTFIPICDLVHICVFSKLATLLLMSLMYYFIKFGHYCYNCHQLLLRIK